MWMHRQNLPRDRKQSSRPAEVPVRDSTIRVGTTTWRAVLVETEHVAERRTAAQREGRNPPHGAHRVSTLPGALAASSWFALRKAPRTSRELPHRGRETWHDGKPARGRLTSGDLNQPHRHEASPSLRAKPPRQQANLTLFSVERRPDRVRRLGSATAETSSRAPHRARDPATYTAMIVVTEKSDTPRRRSSWSRPVVHFFQSGRQRRVHMATLTGVASRKD